MSAAALEAPASGLHSAKPAQLYMGRMPSRQIEPVDMWPHKPEIPHEATADGCPGGWYRTPFAASVLRYRRARTEHGGRVANGLLEGADHQIWAAVLELELQEERSHAHASRTARALREQAKRAAGKKRGRRRRGPGG